MPDNSSFAIAWDEVGKRLYETGVDRGVLYVALDTIVDPTKPYGDGVAWNGLTAVNQTANGGEASPVWADNLKYLNLISAEEAQLSIEAYTYPDEFMDCDGSREVATGVSIGQQTRKKFGLAYRTILGNDLLSNDYGYKIHLVYGCYAAPSDRNYATANDSPEAISFSWSVTTTTIDVSGYKPTATIEIDASKATPAKIASLESILYGSRSGNSNTPGRLPLPAEVITLMT